MARILSTCLKRMSSSKVGGPAWRFLSKQGGDGVRPEPRILGVSVAPLEESAKPEKQLNIDPEMEEKLHPHWKQLEQKVTRHRSRREGPVGRTGRRTWEEDFWLKGGLYDAAKEDAEASASKDRGGK
mmetsp:Transcript_17061/g.65054  ORF Transcript_17061/g.65054 Transcript_17061/m.65054 type:complete len:127 (+) Transcript_17061:174-554(+)